MNNHGAGAMAAGALVFMLLIELAIIVIIIAGLWKVFTKAGQPGWAAIIPIYNLYVLCKVGGKPWWWFILCCIPFVGVIFYFILLLEVAQRFGKGIGFSVGLLFLPFIFFPILGFGNATYGAQPAAT